MMVFIMPSGMELRIQALELLRMMRPRKEGTFDSCVVVKALEKLFKDEDGQNKARLLQAKYLWLWGVGNFLRLEIYPVISH
jgi:hypothetical protein